MAITLIFLFPEGPSENRGEGRNRRWEVVVGKLDKPELVKVINSVN